MTANVCCPSEPGGIMKKAYPKSINPMAENNAIQRGRLKLMQAFCP